MNNIKIDKETIDEANDLLRQIRERVQKARAEDKVRRDIHYSASAGPNVGLDVSSRGAGHTHTFPSTVDPHLNGGYPAGELVTISSDNSISIDPVMRRIEKLEEENEYYKNRLEDMDARFSAMQGEYCQPIENMTIKPPPVMIFDKNEEDVIQQCLGIKENPEAKRKLSLNNASLIAEMEKSYEMGKGELTEDLKTLLIQLVDMMGGKSQFTAYRYLDEMKGLAYERVLASWMKHRNATNPFTLFTQIAKKAFHEVLQEKKLEYRESSYDRAMEVLE